MLEFSSSTKEISAALAAIQSEIKNPKKDAEGVHGAKYATLDATIDSIRTVASKHGVSVVQVPFNSEERFGVESLVLHASGEWIKGSYSVPVKSANPQDYGKVVTYFRRYALGALFNLAPENDDDADSLIPKPQYQSSKPVNDKPSPNIASEAQVKMYLGLKLEELGEAEFKKFRTDLDNFARCSTKQELSEKIGVLMKALGKNKEN